MKKYIFMAVAGMLALSSCSSDDNEQTPQNTPRQMTFTAGFGDGTQTRTTLNTADKSVSFDANDAISIFSENNTNVQFTTTAGGAEATFTGTAVAGDATYYAVYPYNDSYTFSNGIVSGVMIGIFQPMNTNDGETWSKNSVISYATATGSDLVFHNACALLKITNNTVRGDIEISADQSLAGTFDLDTSTGALTVTDGTNSVTTTIHKNNATVYLAIAPGTYTNFTAAKSNWDDAGEWYSKTKASVTFEKGKIYDLGTTSSWMTQQAPALNLTDPAVGQVIGNDGKNYDYASLPGSVTAVALICYVNGSNGLALALADETSTMAWQDAIDACSAKNTSTPVTGATWLLASKDQWTSMINAAGSYTALRDGFSGITGASNLQSDPYWSSTEHEVWSDWAYLYHFSDGECRYGPMTDNCYVRACLAWPQAASAETTDVTWNFSEMTGENPNLNQGYTYKYVTLSGEMGDLNFGMGSLNAMGSGFTFTAPSGKKFTKIVINATGSANINDWTNGGAPGNFTSTWTGDASSVSFSGSAGDITSIVFTLEETDDVTWDFSGLSGSHNLEMDPYTNGVTLQGMGNLDFNMGSLNAMGECTFTAPTGKKFTKIVIKSGMPNISGSGWTNSDDPGNCTSTWTGDASSVSFTGNAGDISSIEFYLEDE